MESHRPLWRSDLPADPLPSLRADLEVDAAVIGMGITGLSAALRLVQQGRRVCVLNMCGLGCGETGRTTAHLTEILDTRYHRLERDFGLEGSRLAAESSRWIIDQIERNVAELSIECSFSRVPGYLYADAGDGQDASEIALECASAMRSGVRAELVDNIPLSFASPRAMLVPRQAQFRPLPYLGAIAEWLEAHGALLYGNTRVVEVQQGEPCVLHTERGFSVRARDVVVATHVPVNDRVHFHTKAFAYRTYALATRSARLPPPGLYWDIADPYRYTRTQETPEGTFLIVGGEDHKVGKSRDTHEPYARLEAYARDRYCLQSVEYRWSGQVIEPADGLPYIGADPSSRHVFVATGFSGNGMTLGALAGEILADLIAARPNRYAELYESTRIKPIAGAREFLTENMDFPAHLVGDRLRSAEARSVDEVGRGDGKIVALSGQKVAVFRDETGKCHALNPVCTHLGCHVQFNAAEQSWDCPCHGGRFDVRGEVLNGPPRAPLERLPDLLPPEERATEGIARAVMPLEG